MRKRLMILSYILVVILLFSACDNPITYHRKPSGQPDSKWRSEDGSVVFTIGGYTELETVVVGNGRVVPAIVYSGEPGTIFTEDGPINIFVHFSAGTSISVTSEVDDSGNDHCYEVWNCSYKSKKHFIATVQETTFFEVGQKIEFYRIDEEEFNTDGLVPQ